jgi:tetratricopeptide (TPR) repeat protein
MNAKLRPSAGLLRLCVLCAALVLAARAQADEVLAETVPRAKAYFKAGAAAYEMGDYLAAIQAFEAAHQLTPYPAIAFSLAQAARRQYFVARDRTHLEMAIELYRGYLQRVPVKGRRADAADALAQLETLAAKDDAAQVGGGSPLPRSSKTRLMISTSPQSARISLDGKEAQPAPLIAQVAPGSHSVQVSAQGHFPLTRSVEAIADELVPLELTLREQPAIALVGSEPDADLYVDGALVEHVAERKQLILTGGRHVFRFAKNGHRLHTVATHLPPGTTRTIDAQLRHTTQRSAALVLFVAGGGSLIASAVLAALALDRENDARELIGERSTRNITSAEFASYRDMVGDRNRLRGFAVAGFIGAAASLVTGLFLYALDQPNVREPLTPGVRATGASGLDLALRF